MVAELRIALRDRLQEGGARGAYGHRSPCTFNQHVLRTV